MQKTVLIRLKFLIAVMFFAFSALIFRILDLGFTSLEEFKFARNTYIKNEKIISRADIVDRNGVLLASNIRTASVYAHPKQLINIHSAAKQLAKLNIGLEEKNLYSKFSAGKDFIWIKRHITPSEQQKIHNLGIPGIYFTSDEKRVYTHDNLYSHILGYVDIDGKGIAGIERLYQDKLTTQIEQPLKISLDTRVQNILNSEIKNSIETHSAIGGSGLVMNVNTGEILALSSLPDFNPNNLNTAKTQNLFNQPTLGVYEMGSIFKVLTIAMGFDTNLININEAFDVSEPLKVGRFLINDYKGKGGSLSVPEILQYSSNLGVAKIAKKFGPRTQREYMARFGLLSDIKDTLPESGKPLFPSEKNWSDASLTTISYGHGIAVSAVHAAQAIGSVVNGGIMYKPTLLQLDSKDSIVGRRVLKKSTSYIMRKLLRLTVENGFGRKADVEGMMVGGKSGTAEKNQNGRYNRNLNIAVFCGIFPINKPEYLVLVMIDEAKPNKINGGYTTGGMIAAPVAGNVIKRMSQVLGLIPQNHNSPEVLQAMYLDYIPRYNTSLAKR